MKIVHYLDGGDNFLLIMNTTGKLFIVGTPIGNLEDITLRALKVLKEAKCIIAEDKRVALKVINKFELGKKELITLNQINQKKQIPKILTLLNEGTSCALVSDAGMPVISDPGSELVNECIKNNITVDVIPGPSAPITALAASGFPGSKFVFLGFLPRDKKRRRLFRTIKDLPFVIVFFENSNRLRSTLEDILEILGNREIFLAREMTKIHQEFIKTTVKNLLEILEDRILKGELTLVLSGRVDEK